MKIELQYGNDAIVLPGAVLSKLPAAGDAELRLLLLLCGDKALREDFDPDAAAEMLGLSHGEIDAALAFWRGAGLLKLPKTGSAKPMGAKTEGAKETKLSPASSAMVAPAILAPAMASGDPSPAPATIESTKGSETPPLKVLRSDGEVHYTGQELDELLERRQELRLLLEECQRIAGKLFSAAESSKVLTLADYYRLPTEYILLLFQYCRTIDKCTVPYAYRTGCELYSQGIATVEQLDEYLKEQELRFSFEGRLRTLLGIGKRALTPKEKRFLSAWAKDGHSLDLITLAFEQTVDATGEPSLPYMNKILTSWKEKGLDTPAAVHAEDAAYRLAKNAGEAASAAANAAAADANAGAKTPSAGAPTSGKKQGKATQGNASLGNASLSKTASGKATRPAEFSSFDPDEFFKVALQKSDERSAEISAEISAENAAEKKDGGTKGEG